MDSKDAHLATTYTLIFSFLNKRSHSKAAEAVKKAAKDVVVLKDGIEPGGPQLDDIIKEWKLMTAKKAATDSDSSSEDDSSSSSSSDSSSDSSDDSSDTSSSSSSDSDSSSDSSSDDDSDDAKTTKPKVIKKSGKNTPAVTKTQKKTEKKKSVPKPPSSSSSESDSDSSSDRGSSSDEKVSQPKKVVNAPEKSHKRDSSKTLSSESDSGSSDSGQEKSQKASKTKADSKKATKPVAKAKGKASSASSDSDSDSDSDSSDSSSTSESDSDAKPKTTPPVLVTKKRRTSLSGTSIATATIYEGANSKNTKEQKIDAKNGRKQNQRFQRVDPNSVASHLILDNRYENKAAPMNDYGAKAHADLIVTRGAGFRKEKNKKKKGSYRGGTITMQSHSFKFADTDD